MRKPWQHELEDTLNAFRNKNRDERISMHELVHMQEQFKEYLISHEKKNPSGHSSNE